MKKVVAIFLSLMLLLGLCSVAQAAVQLPVTADQSAAAGLNHGVTAADMPVIKDVEWADGQIKVTVDPNSMPDLAEGNYNIRIYTEDDNGYWGDDYYFEPIDETGVAVFVVPEGTSYTNIAQIECSTEFEYADKAQDAYGYYNGDGELESYSLWLHIHNGVNESILAEYNADDKLTFESYDAYADGVNENYTVYYYANSGKLREYSVSSVLEAGANLSVDFDQYGRVTWANWYNVQNAYYWENGQWYDFADGEAVATAPIDVTTIEAPYSEDYVFTAPATKLENLDLTKGELTTDEDGAYYYDGIVSATYDENGNLSRYYYMNFEGTQEDNFSFNENGILTSHRVFKVNDGTFTLSAQTNYYANNGLPKGSFYRTEKDEFVHCNADGSVYSLNYYDEETGYDYYWNQWMGWEVTDSEGNFVEVDASTLPNPEDYKGPVLVTVEAVTKDDVKVATSAASVMPELPIALKDLPTITATKVEGNKVSVSLSADAEKLAFYEDDNSLDVYMDIAYRLDGERYWTGSYEEDICTYNPETQTYELTLPEGAEVEDCELSLYRTIDNMYSSYIISENGIDIGIGNDYYENVSQTFSYEDGKLVSTYTSVDGYYLSSTYDAEGNLESYRFPVNESNHATFLSDGTLDFIRYYDSENQQSFYWDATNGWHTREYADGGETFTATAADKPADAMDPEEVKPLIVVSKKPEHIWFPKNTLGLAAVSMKDLGISSDWHNVAPVDLTTDGTTVFTLVGADAWILGNAYVTVAEGNVTVTYDILDGHGYMKSEKMNWFLTKADLTEENLKADSNYAFGEPVSIADQLGGAETAILFIDSKITFRQPYFDAYTYSTRYYRNRENWKEYREGLIEMIK